MRAREIARRIAFVCGLTAIALSFGLVTGSILRPIRAVGYLKQAEAMRPWVHWEMGSALVGFALCFFGQGRWRFFSVLLALVLFAWWYGEGMALV
jgi:hypothetical protein